LALDLVARRAVLFGGRDAAATKGPDMKRNLSLLMAAGAFAVAPAMAAPPSGGGGAMNHGVNSIAPATPKSPTGNGGGYNHMNVPQHATGQPMQSCETTGSPPGNSGTAPGGGSPFIGDSSKAGQNYAGSAPQNSRNTASVSQYDVACANQPH
jgi:hypothetical protein